MVRSFDGTAIDLDWLEQTCATALLAPSAGHSAGVRMTVAGRDRIGEYLDLATDSTWRERAERLEGWSGAGALVLVSVQVGDYLARYAEADKAGSGLDKRDAWPLPYWHTDAAMATMSLLLLIEESEFAAGIWGAFRHAEDVARWAGLDDEELFATIFVGRPDGRDRRSRSLDRPVPRRADRVRRMG